MKHRIKLILCMTLALSSILLLSGCYSWQNAFDYAMTETGAYDALLEQQKTYWFLEANDGEIVTVYYDSPDGSEFYKLRDELRIVNSDTAVSLSGFFLTQDEYAATLGELPWDTAQTNAGADYYYFTDGEDNGDVIFLMHPDGFENSVMFYNEPYTSVANCMIAFNGITFIQD